MRNIKHLTLLVLLSMLSLLVSAQTLNLYVKSQRFLDKDKQSIVHIDYQIPYNNLVFLAHKGGYFAELDITVDVVQGDSIIFQRSIRDNIGISNKEDASSDKTYLNRVSFYLSEAPSQFRIIAKDVNSQKVAQRSLTLEKLSSQAIISDLELCSIVRPDSSSYLDKFHRGKVLYQTQPSLIFDKNISEQITLYFEVYTSVQQRNESSLLVLTIEKDSLVVSDDFIDFYPAKDIDGITLKIPIADLAPGKYVGTLGIQVGENSAEKVFEFFITEPRIEQFLLFPNPDDDYQLLRYFQAGIATANWKNYDEKTKRRYITQSWKNWAFTNTMGVQTMLDLIRERVDYANRYYGHFDPGWTSDMGRIHIRNGKPDEIDRDTSSDETRYVRKDYQIWKYRGKINAVYLFVDIQMNGNYKLLYVNNDQRESSNPDYLRYLGEDFDTSLLEN